MASSRSGSEHTPRRGKSSQRPPRARGAHGSRKNERDDIVRIFGLHAVKAALANPERRVLSLRMTENASARLAEAIAARAIEVTLVSPRDLDKMLGSDTVHQGALVEAEPLQEPSLEDLAECAQSGGPIVILDQVTDPHNVGAVLRSAAVFGSSGLVLTRRNSPPLSGVLAKSASGGLELVPVHLASNLSRALGALQSQGIAIIGLDGEASTAIEDVDFKVPCALVLGAEGKGLRKLTRETCDALCRINPAGPLASLNVSNAAAVSLHLAAMRRRGA